MSILQIQVTAKRTPKRFTDVSRSVVGILPDDGINRTDIIAEIYYNRLVEAGIIRHPIPETSDKK